MKTIYIARFSNFYPEDAETLGACYTREAAQKLIDNEISNYSAKDMRAFERYYHIDEVELKEGM